MSGIASNNNNEFALIFVDSAWSTEPIFSWMWEQAHKSLGVGHSGERQGSESRNLSWMDYIFQLENISKKRDPL